MISGHQGILGQLGLWNMLWGPARVLLIPTTVSPSSLSPLAWIRTDFLREGRVICFSLFLTHQILKCLPTLWLRRLHLHPNVGVPTHCSHFYLRAICSLFWILCVPNGEYFHKTEIEVSKRKQNIWVILYVNIRKAKDIRLHENWGLWTHRSHSTRADGHPDGTQSSRGRACLPEIKP